MDAELSQGLTFLAWTGGAFLIIVGAFLVKLLFDLSRLTNSLNKSADIVQRELDPIMKNISETTTTVNTIVQTTNSKVGKVAEAYDKASQVVVKSVTKLSVLSAAAFKELSKGVFFAIKSLLCKK